MPKLSQATLEKKYNTIGVYDAHVYLYGIKSAKDKLRIKVGLGSNNHWEKIQELIEKEYDGTAVLLHIVSVKVKPSKSLFGIGSPQSYSDY